MIHLLHWSGPDPLRGVPGTELIVQQPSLKLVNFYWNITFTHVHTCEFGELWILPGSGSLRLEPSSFSFRTLKEISARANSIVFISNAQNLKLISKFLKCPFYRYILLSPLKWLRSATGLTCEPASAVGLELPADACMIRERKIR